CLGVTLVAAGAVHAAQPKTLLPGRLSVCLFATFPPFAEKSEAGQWAGWDIDFLRRFADKLGLTFVPVPVADYDGFWTRPGADACDIAASGIADLPYRRVATGDAGIWSGPYYFVQRAFGVRREDAGNLTGVRDLAGRTILVIAGSTADVDARARVARAGVSDVTVIGTSDDVENARRVRDGKAHDLSIAGRPDIAAPGSGLSGAGVIGTGASSDARPADDPFAFGSGLGTVQYLADRMGLVVVWPHCLMMPDGQVRDEPFSFVVRARRLWPYAGRCGPNRRLRRRCRRDRCALRSGHANGPGLKPRPLRSRQKKGAFAALGRARPAQPSAHSQSAHSQSARLRFPAGAALSLPLRGRALVASLGPLGKGAPSGPRSRPKAPFTLGRAGAPASSAGGRSTFMGS
ncbi:MAG: hypothetical protein B7Z15_23850, partial [Rhizobiales bacterium 32-66-8]